MKETLTSELVQDLLTKDWGALCRRAGTNNVKYIAETSIRGEAVRIDASPGGADIPLMEVLTMLKTTAELIVLGYKAFVWFREKYNKPPTEGEFSQKLCETPGHTQGTVDAAELKKVYSSLLTLPW